ncbi:MAG: hypothetical protein ABEH78_06220 [Haloferacaceae archaeon]
MLTVANVMIPLGETLIGLGLIVGCLVRLASFFGAFLLLFFYFGNAAFDHGYVNGDLFGLLLFVSMIVRGAGRVYGIDAVLERTGVVENHPRLRYLLGGERVSLQSERRAELAADTTTADRIVRVLGGALAVAGVVVDPRLLAAGLVVWLLYAPYTVANG